MSKSYNENDNDKDNEKEEEQSDLIKAIAYFGRVAFTIAACILICVLLGNFLDNLLGTSPWLLLLFSLIGLGAAFKSIFDLAKK